MFASPIIHLVYGESFVDASAPILRVLALIIPVNVTGAVFGVWLMTLHRDRLIMTIAVVAGVANVVLGCVFTLLFGPIGMAWSVITAEAIGAAGGLLAVRREARAAAAGPIAEVDNPGQASTAASADGARPPGTIRGCGGD